MASQTLLAVEALVHALNTGDITDILDAFTEDAVFAADGGTAQGRDQIAALFDPVLHEPRALMILRSTVQAGDTLDCRVTRRFTVSDGRQALSHDVEIRCVFTVRDGAVSRVEVDPVA